MNVADECLRRHAAAHARLLGSGLPVVAAGGQTAYALSGFDLGVVETRGSLLPLREGLDEFGGARWITQTLHPSYLVRGAGADEEGKAQDHLQTLLVLDLRKALASSEPFLPLVRTGSAALVREMRPRGIVSVDIEGSDVPTIVGLSWGEHRECWSLDWGPDVRDLLTELFVADDVVPLFHNGAFDVAQLGAAGVPWPARWLDTIVVAGVFEQQLPLGLQQQVLAHVPGSVAWKGLVNHNNPTGEDATTQAYQWMHNKFLSAAGRVGLFDGMSRYRYYNAIDTCGTGRLLPALREAMGERSWAYYEQLHQPLQRPLLEIGVRGIPTDPERRRGHRARVERAEGACRRIVQRAGRVVLAREAERRRAEQAALIAEREAEAAQHKAAGGKGRPRFSKSLLLTKANTKARQAEQRVVEGLNLKSTAQKQLLLTEWLGLPLAKGKKTKGVSTDEKALSALLSRIERGTLKPKQVTKLRARWLLMALIRGSELATLRTNFLTAGLKGDWSSDEARRGGEGTDGAFGADREDESAADGPGDGEFSGAGVGEADEGGTDAQADSLSEFEVGVDED